MGPSCCGSPARTTCLPQSVLLLGKIRPAMATRLSGSVAWLASSMKMWVKWSRANWADTNLSIFVIRVHFEQMWLYHILGSKSQRLVAQSNKKIFFVNQWIKASCSAKITNSIKTGKNAWEDQTKKKKNGKKENEKQQRRSEEAERKSVIKWNK